MDARGLGRLREKCLAADAEEGRADLRSASGPGAGAFLLPPEDASDIMEDTQFRVASRLRLHVPRAGALGLSSPSLHCNHRASSDGTICGEALDSSNSHQLKCKIGGLVTERHDRLRDWLAALLRRVLGPGAGVTTEQYVLAWDRVGDDGKVEHARLDVTYVVGGRRVYLDVAVVTARSADVPTQRAQGARDGAAADREEDSKRRRYPGPDLRPFVVEALGRLGGDATALLRELAPAEPAARSLFIRRAQRELSVHLQSSTAELLLRAEQ